MEGGMTYPPALIATGPLKGVTSVAINSPLLMSSSASGDLQPEVAELLVAPAPEALEQGIYPEHRRPASIEPRHYGRNLPGG